MREIVEEYGEYIVAFFTGMGVVGCIYSVVSILMASAEKFLLNLC